MLNYMSIFSWFKKNKQLGKVVHYFDKINVAVVQLTGKLKVGDTVKFKHGVKEFEQMVGSMQVNHVQVQSAKAGEEVAIYTEHEANRGTLLLKA